MEAPGKEKRDSSSGETNATANANSRCKKRENGGARGGGGGLRILDSCLPGESTLKPSTTFGLMSDGLLVAVQFDRWAFFGPESKKSPVTRKMGHSYREQK
ncbi:hypothetical protein NL676_028476 [Syzygium grande]|nr:hypothetical protein NL676_028476 [Syzygium grande]